MAPGILRKEKDRSEREARKKDALLERKKGSRKRVWGFCYLHLTLMFNIPFPVMYPRKACGIVSIRSGTGWI